MDRRSPLLLAFRRFFAAATRVLPRSTLAGACFAFTPVRTARTITRHARCVIVGWRAVAFLAVTVLGIALAPPARAQLNIEDRHRGCIRLATGPAQYTIDGREYTFKSGGMAQVVDAGGGLCGPYTEFALHLRVLPGAGFVLVAPAGRFRVHTRSPAADGVDVGLSLGAGINFVSAGETRLSPPNDTFDGTGGFFTVGPDVRGWFSERWGIGGAVDLSFGAADDQLVAMLAATFGAFHRW